MMRCFWIAAIAAIRLSGAEGTCTGVHTLRAASQREWSDFPSQAPSRLECVLQIPAGSRTLVLRQDDVKRQDWKVSLNGRELGGLVADEHRQMLVLEIPDGVILPAGNKLAVAAASPAQLRDDIRIDRIAAHVPTPSAWSSQATLRVRVAGGLPVRITLSDSERTLLAHGAKSADGTAARTGVVYTLSGKADIPVPAGRYIVWASRGFEYSAAKAEVMADAGDVREVPLSIRREVRIPGGWTAGDTHLHTFERSGHGDSTVAERIVSIAGEGLDWAICTEHNLASTYAVPGNVFTPIRGVEITTPKGHFNVFPWPADKPVPDPRGAWPEAITPEMAVIWNHPRDTHSGFKPFDPSRYIAIAGEGHHFPGNAMEVVNSGAMYSHPLQLAEDWMRLLNRGRKIAAIGSSDSHTVTTFAAGQARTYVRGGDVSAAIQRSDTAVSYGLAAFLEQTAEGRLMATVYGPSWSPARRVRVYANGELIADREIQPALGKGKQWEGEIQPPKLRRDAFLTVIATGSEDTSFWPISRPYQPVTPDWQPMTLGISPALRWDGNGDGRFETPRQQAEGLLRRQQSIAVLLKDEDPAVAAQVALLLAPRGRKLQDLIAAAGAALPARTREVLQQVRDFTGRLE